MSTTRNARNARIIVPAPKSSILAAQKPEPARRRARWDIILLGLGLAVGLAGITTSVVMTTRVLLEEPDASEPREDTLRAAIETAARARGVDPKVLVVIAEKESGGGKPSALYRFEPSLYARLRKDRKFSSRSDDEVRMLASSHGAFHILGATAEERCGLPFWRLYDQSASADCAASIVAGLQASGASLGEVFRRYNGSGPKAESYSADGMRRHAALARGVDSRPLKG